MNENVGTNYEELKNTIAANLVKFRKQANFTQQEIAEKIHYSDKAVSKWERADGIPDVLVLKTLADIYGITVNDFLIVHDDAPLIKPRRMTLFAKRLLTTLISAGLVWLVATAAFVIGQIINPKTAMWKYTFIPALPASCIVILVFCCLWGKLWQKCLSVSALIWTLCLLVDIALALVPNSYLIYIIGAATQLLVVLWFLLRFFILKDRKKEK